jgi:toxin FitB
MAEALRRSTAPFLRRLSAGRASARFMRCSLPCQMLARILISIRTAAEMFLVDTSVISELRKGGHADPGVRSFLKEKQDELFLPVQAIGELSFGVESLRRKGEFPQAERVSRWLDSVLETFDGRVLSFDQSCALIWGRLRSANDQNLIDKQIAAMALIYGLTVVTRNIRHYDGTGALVLNPFFADRPSGPPVH